MARGYKRLSFRARHLLRQLGKAKNITLQRLNLHELRHAISRKHGFKGPKKTPGLGTPGLYQRLSRRARHLMRRLRHSRTWQVQKQTVNELEREVERGARIAQARETRRERREERIDRAAERAGRMAKRAQERGRQFRKWAQRKQEPALARAERRQAKRGPRKPGRIRSRVQSWQRTRQRRPRTRQLNGSRWARVRGRGSRPPKTLRPQPAQVRNLTPRTPRAPRPPRTRAPRRPARTR